MTELVTALVIEPVVKAWELGSCGGEVGTSISSSELSVPLVGMTIWRVPLARVSQELTFVALTP